MTAAHFQNIALREELRLWFPAHEPREHDPAYRLFHAAKKRMRELDLPCWRCGVHYKDLNSRLHMASTSRNPLAAHQLEAHHGDLEFSLLNGVDVEKWWRASRHWDDTPNKDGFIVEAFSHVDRWLEEHPEYEVKGDGTPEEHQRIFMAYMESDGNLLQLCFATGTPVLTPDGWAAIQELRPGDLVVGPDGDSRPVTAAIARSYHGPLVNIDGRRMTPNHPVLTPAGWLPAGCVRAGQVLAHFMHVAVAEMLGLRTIEPQVLDAVVRPLAVDVMDPLARFQSPAEMLLHHPAMLGYRNETPVAIDQAATVAASRVKIHGEQDALGGGSTVVERPEVARIGAVAHRSAVAVAKLDPTMFTPGRLRMDTPSALLPLAGAGITASDIPGGDLRRNQERTAADDAFSLGARAARDARWRAVRQVRRESYAGFVHDITVASYPAFVAGDLVAHNCDICHRSRQQGIHKIEYPDWRPLAVWRRDLPAHVQ